MALDRLKTAWPYGVGLALAAFLWMLTGEFQFTLRPGQLGPAFWPRLAIGLMTVVCLFELCKTLLGLGHGEIKGIASELNAEEASDDPVQSRPIALALGVALILIYAALIPILGYLLASFLFVIAFMYVGGYRRHGIIFASATLGIMAIAIIFLKLVYVSLPRGQPPFDGVTNFITTLIGVN
jgi:putative tricarboxylic transport membrane protein